MIRTIAVLAGGTVLTFALAGRIVVESRLRRGPVHGLCERIGRLWSGSMLRIAGARVRLIDSGKVDWSRPVVVVANHQSWFDVFALAAHIPGKARFVAKEELARIPIFGPAWQACGHVSVNRKDRGRAIASLDAAGRQVREESLAMILFPEGTRSPDGGLRSFRKGAFVLAIKTGVPVVPVGIAGSRGVMPKGSFRIRRGEIRIRVGEPIPTADLGPGDRDALLERSRGAVLELMEDPDGLAPPEAGADARDSMRPGEDENEPDGLAANHRAEQGTGDSEGRAG